MKTFDLTDKTSAKRRKPILEIMENLEPGQKCVHDHTKYRTPFSTWLAQQRVRLGKPFKGSRLSGDIFTVSVPEDAAVPA